MFLTFYCTKYHLAGSLNLNTTAEQARWFRGEPVQEEIELTCRHLIRPPRGHSGSARRPAALALDRAPLSHLARPDRDEHPADYEAAAVREPPNRINDDHHLTSKPKLCPLKEQKRPHFVAMISYSHAEGSQQALSLKAALAELGLSAYLDVHEIKSGADWQDSLNEAIWQCHVFAALVTPSYGQSLWTSRELKLADLLGKLVVPIKCCRQWPPPRLAIQLASRQYIEPAGRWTPAEALSAAAQIRESLQEAGRLSAFRQRPALETLELFRGSLMISEGGDGSSSSASSSPEDQRLPAWPQPVTRHSLSDSSPSPPSSPEVAGRAPDTCLDGGSRDTCQPTAETEEPKGDESALIIGVPRRARKSLRYRAAKAIRRLRERYLSESARRNN